MNKWYTKKGKDMDVAISSRIRLARNMSDIPFKTQMTLEQKKEVIGKVSDALSFGNFGDSNAITRVNLDEMTSFEKIKLVESHLVSIEFINDLEGKALFLSEDNSISIMVNEEDHIRIQVLSAGNNVLECYQMANNIDNLLDTRLKYAFDNTLGFLTHCPTNLGTGMRASVMLHLPMLESKHLWTISQNLSKVGLTLRGTYGEASKVAGSYYQMSNQVTLGITEEMSIEKLGNVVSQIIEIEKSLRNEMENLEIKDSIYRMYGVAKYARKLSADEIHRITSLLRLGIYYKYFDWIDYKNINEIIFNYSLVEAKENSTKEEINLKRAGQIRSMIENLENIEKKDVDVNV